MKKRILIMATLVAGLAMTACSVDTSELEKAGEDMKKEMNEAVDDATDEAKDKAESTSTVMYQCPDNCENGPAYFKEGPCKQCGKDMVEI